MREETPVSSQAENPAHGGYEGQPSGTQTANVGHQLRLAREERGLSVDEVALALKLSPRQVEALEANDWTHLPKTIIRGFVRNYARYLELDAGAFMAALDGMPLPRGPELAVQVGSPVSMPRDGGADRHDYLRVVAGGIVLLLAVLAYFFVPAETWRSTLDSVKELVQAKKAAREVIQEPAKESGRDASTTVVTSEPIPVPDTASTQTVHSSPEAPAEQTPTAPAAVPSSPTSPSEALVFSFVRPAWVEVRDRSGQIVFSQLSQAGSRREVNGQPPFSLVVGNATYVTVQYKGKPVDLSKRSKDDVARLILE